MSEAATDPAPTAADDAAAPGEKSEKQLKREAEKKAKKRAEAEKKAAKLAARQERGQGGGAITVGVVQHPPVELEPPSGTRVSTVHASQRARRRTRARESIPAPSLLAPCMDSREKVGSHPAPPFLPSRRSFFFFFCFFCRSLFPPRSIAPSHRHRRRLSRQSRRSLSATSSPPLRRILDEGARSTRPHPSSSLCVFPPTTTNTFHVPPRLVTILFLPPTLFLLQKIYE